MARGQPGTYHPIKVRKVRVDYEAELTGLYPRKVIHGIHVSFNSRLRMVLDEVNKYRNALP